MTISTLGSKMKEKVSYISKNPGVARVMFKAQTRLDGGTQCSAYVRKFPVMLVDEPPDLGGSDAGHNPLELLLVSLGTCQEIVYSLFAAMMEIELEAVTVDLKGQIDVRGLLGIDESVPAGYQKVTFETRITSSAPPADLEKLVRTVEACCPTLDTLKRPVDVSGSVFLNGEPFATA